MPSQRLSPECADLPGGWVAALAKGTWSATCSRRFHLSAGATLAINLPVAIILLLVTLQPVKGTVIAFLCWHGIGAFRQERRAPEEEK